jgi:hypothetical protein
MPRFVIQQHDRQGEPRHWDLMLEQGDDLKTFRLDIPPDQLLIQPAKAIPITDHSLRFLTYEGSVNKGLGRVEITERGTYKTFAQGNDSWELELDGQILKGRFSLTRSTSDSWDMSKV